MTRWFYRARLALGRPALWRFVAWLLFLAFLISLSLNLALVWLLLGVV